MESEKNALVGGGRTIHLRRGAEYMKTETTVCRLRIRREECVGCAACPAVCHTLALNMDALELVLDEGLCDNCSMCIHVCPVGALYFG